MKTAKDEAQMSIEERLAVIEVTNEHINRTLIDMKQDMNRNFDKIEQRFMTVDQRFVSIDQRFNAVDEKINSLEKKMDKRFESIDKRFESIDKRFDSLENRVWSNFIWMMSGFAGLAGLIAHAQHWI